MKERHRILLALGLILLVAAGIRVFGCFGQGYPYSFYDDEKANVLRALSFGARASLDPDWFNKPALGYYLLFGEYGLYYLAGRATGHFGSPDDFALAYVENQGPFYLIGRLSVTVFGLLTIFLTWRLGKALFDARTGLLAALALTFTLGHVASCQEVKMDVPSTFFTAWAALALYAVMLRGRLRNYIGGGFVAGLGIATKYYSVALGAPLAFAHLFGRRAAEAGRRSWRRLMLGFVAMGAGFFLGSPYNFINPKGREWLFGQLRFVGRRFGLGALQYDVETNPRGVLVEDGSIWTSVNAFLDSLVSTEGMGPVLCVLALLGLLVVLRRRSRADGFLLTTVASLALLLIIFNRQYTQPRHLNPLYPFMAILAAAGMGLLMDLGRRGLRSRPRGGTLGVAGGAVLGLLFLLLPLPSWPGRVVIDHDLRRVAPDPRVQFLHWFEAKVPEGETVINDFGKIPIVHDQARCDWVFERLEKLRRQGRISEERRRAYATWWRYKRIAAGSYEGRTYDVIELVHPWQVERLHKRLQALGDYNPIWPASPWGWLMGQILDREYRAGRLSRVTRERVLEAFKAALRSWERKLAPVEFWTLSTMVSRAFLCSPRRPVRWMVTTRVSYDNYRTEHKRRHFPDFAAFYEDLREHYLCYEFNSGDPDPARVIRLYDLRRRLEAPRVVRVNPDQKDQ